jgi:hypothetical protein
VSGPAARARRIFKRHINPIFYRMRHAGADLPIVFGNSFPKSGTNLLLQILGSLTALDAFLDRETFILTYRRGVKRAPEAVTRDLVRLLPGEVAGGHVFATEANKAAFRERGARCLFIYRDPRDVAVSHAFFVTNMAPYHAHHDYYANVLTSMEERIATSIVGRPGIAIEFPNIRARFEPYLGWLQQEYVLPLRFEDLIHDRRRTLERMLDHIEAGGYRIPAGRERALDVFERSIDPSKSRTFREGRTGSWREHFTSEHRALFADVSGDLLAQLGYDE